MANSSGIYFILFKHGVQSSLWKKKKNLSEGVSNGNFLVRINGYDFSSIIVHYRQSKRAGMPIIVLNWNLL